MGDYHSKHAKCCCPCHEEHHHDHEEHDYDEHEGGDASFLFEIADCAWREVLKDKIKEIILSTRSEHMAELAKIISEANHRRWQHKMEKKQCCAEFKEKICNFFKSKK